MRLFAIGVKHALDVAVQCPHDADARATESATGSGKSQTKTVCVGF
jgi:hypothetical protein